jgi:two-component sensor histidine kinase/PAS domain-containing protein
MHYIVGLSLAVGLVVIRALIETAAPGIAYLVLLLPVVAIAGVFWGTVSAILAGLAGVAVIIVFFVRQPLTAWPVLNPTQIDLLALIPACAAVLWATHTLRASVACAAAAEARLAEAFRQIPGAAAILEAPSGRLLLRSSQSDKVLGQPERSVGLSDDLGTFGGLHSDGRAYEPDEYPIIRALRAGEVVRGEHLRYRRLDGRLTDLEVYAGPVRGADGRILVAVGMAFDVSDRMRQEQLLRESEAKYRAATERLRAAIDAGTLGLWERDVATDRVSLDAALAAMLGLPAEAITLEHADLMRFFHPADHSRARDVFTGAIAAGMPYADEIRLVTAQNEERWFVVRGALLAGTGTVLGVSRDVTEWRKREEALRASLETRELLMREADHRIKNSLQLVISLLRLQLGRIDNVAARRALEAAVTRIASVSESHLALQNSPDMKSVQIDGILEDLCRRLALLNPSVAVLCRTSVGLWLEAEQAISLGLIASEVLTNALRHAFPPETAGEVVLTAILQEGTLQMTIADSGVGLPVIPVRPGLGTTVITALAKQIGATLDTQSQHGVGTTVTIRLNLATVCAA